MIYAARGASFRAAHEEVLRAGVHLNGLNARRAKLRGARLDGLIAPGACFWGADLTRSDLADADLTGCDLRMAGFKETCLADAVLRGADLSGAYFAGTLLDGADLGACRFSCPSILRQPLHRCRSLEGAVYWHRGETACALAGGVAHFSAGGHAVTVIDRHLIADGRLIPGRGYTTKSSNIKENIANCEET